MNVFQLVLKQMRQRSLSTWLTLLSVVLGVALAIAIMILRREGQNLFGQTDYGYDVLVGPKGSPLQVVLNTAYHIDRSPGAVPYALYEGLSGPDYRRMVRLAVPFAVGDTYQNQRIVGTLPTLFGVGDDGAPVPSDRAFQYRPGRRYELAEGRVFHPRKFEAVIGSDISRLTGLKIGDQFKATHGGSRAGQTPDEHDTQWTVVGVLRPTLTANDRVLFIPLISFYAIAEHDDAMEAMSKYRVPAESPLIPTTTAPATQEALKRFLSDAPSSTPRSTSGTVGEPASGPGERSRTAGGSSDDHDHDHDGKQDHKPEDHDHHAHEHFALNPDGTIELELPKDKWLVNAILIQSRGAFNASSLMYQINNGPDAMAVNPAMVMREFFSNFLDTSSRVLLLISLLVTVVAGVSILVSIYNSVSARKKEIAILRALGATRTKVLALICIEAGFVGLLGGVIGLIVGHLLGAAGSVYMRRLVGEGINWTTIGKEEALYLAAVLAIAVLAGLVPALKAYRTPVATNLGAG